MSVFLADPSVLTKDKLKSVLVANNVALPDGEQRKGVYVQLYLRNLTCRNTASGAAGAFSSDEELQPEDTTASRSGRKATKKTDRVPPEEMDVTVLTNEDLKGQLLKYGVSAGPIVASTRKVYEKRLQKLLDQGGSDTTPPRAKCTQTGSGYNGTTQHAEQYSDMEGETTPADPDPVPVVERPVRSRGKPSVTPRTLGSRHRDISEMLPVPHERGRDRPLAVPRVPTPLLADEPESSPVRGDSWTEPRRSRMHLAHCARDGFQEIEKLSCIEQTPKVTERNVLKEMFSSESLNTPTGISATCRRPIKGAAGRPVSDVWLGDLRPRLTEIRRSSSSYTESRSVPRVSAVPFTPSRPMAPPAVQAKARRRVPVWVRLLLLSAVAGFLFLVYQAMETNEMSPFGHGGSNALDSK
ncbi:hypothetical protein P4O66_014212 [Electrophorus voltai]|uniref:LEM domain-containing protein n=1 Tax=Electrophorus voltai TaxID=2609070 RepID=A0AAD9DPF1_9TELE|nr:hypothetical protein P4O66_014212 [Electrophorus voltai]